MAQLSQKVFSSRTIFEKMDFYLYTPQKRYTLRTHANKSKGWIYLNYFGALNPSHPEDKWVFGYVKTKNYIIKHRWVGIQRHNMVPNKFSPDDPVLKSFWLKRNMSGKDSNILPHKSISIANKQRHHTTQNVLSIFTKD